MWLPVGGKKRFFANFVIDDILLKKKSNNLPKELGNVKTNLEF